VNFYFETLVHKKITKVITSEEEAMLVALLEQDSTLQKVYDQYAAIWQHPAPAEQVFNGKAAYQKFLDKTKTADTLQVDHSSHITPKKSNLRLLKMVASVAAVFTLGLFAFQLITKDNLTTVSTQEVAALVSLPDQSTVSLAPHSTITYDKKGFNSDRHLTLDGKASFDVEKNKGSFVVNAKDFDVTVLGTTFTVETTGAQKNVKVLEGKVAVKTPKSASIILTDRQSTIIEENKPLEVIPASFDKDGWIKPAMSYNKEPLSRVLSDIEIKFGVKIELKSSTTLESCTFTSTESLSESSLNEVMQIIESAFNAKFIKKADNAYSVNLAGCN
jgi:transmembrane sensor